VSWKTYIQKLINIIAFIKFQRNWNLDARPSWSLSENHGWPGDFTHVIQTMPWKFITNKYCTLLTPYTIYSKWEKYLSCEIDWFIWYLKSITLDWGKVHSIMEKIMSWVCPAILLYCWYYEYYW